MCCLHELDISVNCASVASSGHPFTYHNVIGLLRDSHIQPREKYNGEDHILRRMTSSGHVTGDVVACLPPGSLLLLLALSETPAHPALHIRCFPRNAELFTLISRNIHDPFGRERPGSKPTASRAQSAVRGSIRGAPATSFGSKDMIGQEKISSRMSGGGGQRTSVSLGSSLNIP